MGEEAERDSECMHPGGCDGHPTDADRKWYWVGRTVHNIGTLDALPDGVAYTRSLALTECRRCHAIVALDSLDEHARWHRA